jgi:hypothetical protein
MQEPISAKEKGHLTRLQRISEGRFYLSGAILEMNSLTLPLLLQNISLLKVYNQTKQVFHCLSSPVPMLTN